MKSQRQLVPQEFSELRMEMQRMRQRDSHFAYLVEQFDALDARLERAESGMERIDELSLGRLKRSRQVYRDTLAHHFKRATEQCCGCGKACSSR
ncbi:YdcH family protein [Aquipseudomonas ullengensis]|uniref:DUF465 domain-containing protein n=1 Tax=Aquipseudomonas ullengensis TaxID=2759166 RepID=A0A7W4LLJ1_9GAMM|nr:DUF465 domain-containing protein [Pseudomonas ullengensis]MBB2495372.1 DUF465 domain-containing protein [Pseudomonas ullengensis]